MPVFLLTATAVVHYNSEACATNAVVTEAHIPAGPDLHMLVFLGYMAVRMLYMPVISALYLVSVFRRILERQLKLCYLIAPL